MGKFHSTISRRDFMKAVGLGGLGAAAVAGGVPVFTDLDEVLGREHNFKRMPWYVSERDMMDPTVPIDWDPKWRVDGRLAREYRNPDSDFYFDAYSLEQCHLYHDYAMEEDPNYDWNDPRRQALDFMSRRAYSGDRYSFLGPDSTRGTNPTDTGYPKWNGTPEENMKLLRGAVRFLGGDDIGVAEHDTKLDRFLCTYDMEGYRMDYISASEPSIDTENRIKVIPNSFKWCFTWTYRQPMDLTRRQQGGILRGYPDCNPLRIGENASVWYCYFRMNIVEIQLMGFIRALGYDCVAGGMQSITSGTAIATATGMLEHARMGQVALHPKWGATVRGTYKMFTNLPLVPTKPIDAGIYEFCKTCGICAEHCPGGIIQKNEPTWTTGRNPEKGDEGEPLPYQSQGYLGWRTDIGKCPHCPTCQGTCPFNQLADGSWTHDITKAVIAQTSLFNGFFTQMDKWFDYGRKPQVDFWDIWDQLPSHGIAGDR
jgi:reductive dehalogenase